MVGQDFPTKLWNKVLVNFFHRSRTNTSKRAGETNGASRFSKKVFGFSLQKTPPKVFKEIIKLAAKARGQQEAAHCIIGDGQGHCFNQNRFLRLGESFGSPS
jgi:hypothetical protein